MEGIGKRGRPRTFLVMILQPLYPVYDDLGGMALRNLPFIVHYMC